MVRFRIFVAILFVGLISFSCRKEKTSWDTEWIAPIAYGTLNLDNAIQDNVFAVNADSTLQLIYKTDIVNLNFDSLFKIPDTTIVEKIAFSLSLNVPPNYTFISQVDERQFDIDNAQIKDILIKQGKALVEVQNPFETGVIVDITLPGVEKDGIPFNQSVFVNAGTTSNPSAYSFEVDFTGYSMDLKGSSGNSWNTLQSVFTVTSDPNGDTTYCSNLDSVQFSVEFQDVIPSYGKGYFGNRILSSIDTVELDFMRNFVSGSFLLDQANMNLNIVNGVKVVATGKVNSLLSVNSENSTSINLTHPSIGQNININSATGGWGGIIPFIYPININSGNSNINPFIENLPDQLIMDYEVEINPLGNISGGNDEFFPDSELKVALDLDMPTAFSVNNLVFVDTLDLNFDQDPNGIQIKDGLLKITAENYFPFDLNFSLVFLDDMGLPIDTLNSIGDVLAGIPNANGKVLSPRNSEVLYDVDESFMNVIENATKVQIMGRINNSNHPTTLSIYDYYSIDLKITTNIGLLIQL